MLHLISRALITNGLRIHSTWGYSSVNEHITLWVFPPKNVYILSQNNKINTKVSDSNTIQYQILSLPTQSRPKHDTTWF